MMHPEVTIGRPLSGSLSTTSAFEEEQRDLLWRRSRLVFSIALAITALVVVLSLLIPETSDDPSLITGLARWEWLLDGVGPAISFALGLIALYLAKGSARRLQMVAFGVIAFNVAFMLFVQVALWPDGLNFFGLSILLFLTAAFIPWRTGFQIGLGLTAVITFLMTHSVFYAFVPAAQAFWVERGGLQSVLGQVTWGTIGIAILAGSSVAVTQALYNLRKTAHRAKRLGNYLIERELGSGGMGQVFVAQHAFIRRPTAVKVLQLAKGEDQGEIARFEREVQLSATLTHPNTITIFDFGRTHDNRFYYAMEYLEGLDLQQLVERFGPMPPARAAYILAQVCGSLAEAHAHSIIHRDIKPSNIFLTRCGDLCDFAKVLDFGLAKRIGADQASGVSKTGVVLGTPRYIAPESVTGSDDIDGRADIYCLGGVAYWMLTGQPPFTSSSSVEVIIDHVKTVPKRPSELSEVPIPPELEAIVMKCLEKKPQDRFQNAGALRAALRAIHFAETWSEEKAGEWWSLHGVADAQAAGSQSAGSANLNRE